ncbi:M15 family metallopeptidase [Streptomyces sp. NBC_00555]|uniref:M15 family metallopeptidase n=1 Tax=Streptomyces sp. NBC_00555 TaxID=2903662 RepID=UPI00225A432F|nr:M15 family metallopeptidase [Streptomyces sp. NBC_00555]MCX5016608.1 M15 family metallopeptidase [Streptomyces sp. NBC_00555]
MSVLVRTARAAALSAAVAVAVSAAAPPFAPAPAAAAAPKPPKAFVALSDVDPTIRQEIRYYTPNNFVGEPINGYLQPTCILTRPAAQALHRAQRALLRQGYSLKVYDCYRPQRSVDHFVTWAKDLDDQAMKAEFYPQVDKSRLFEDGYIAERSGHSRGSTLDLTLVKLPVRPTPPYDPDRPLIPCYAAQEDRAPDNSVDMGTGFDCFDTLSHTLDPRIQGEQKANRLLLKSTLETAGFKNLPEEWWHYTLRDEPFPDTYFDFPVSKPAR